MTPFDPLLTPEQLQEGLEAFNTEWLPVYRLALQSLTKSSTDLAEAVRREDGAETLHNLFEMVCELQQWRKTENALLNAAIARLGLTLQAYVDETKADPATKPETTETTEEPEQWLSPKATA